MDVSKINQAIQFTLSESDEMIVRKKKEKKKEESVIVSKNMSEESVSAILEKHEAPALPNFELIKEKILNNEYKVDCEKLAEKMIELEKLWID